MNNDINLLTDLFVERVNELSHDETFVHDIPPSVRTVANDGYPLSCGWKIMPYDASEWISQLEAKLPKPFPKSFHSLISRYIFPRFTIRDINLFANTPEGVYDGGELRTAIFQIEEISHPLLKNGYIQFARPEDDYDPICFDTNASVQDDEYRIVRIEHESLGWKNTDHVFISSVIAASFQELISNFLEEHKYLKP